MYIFIWHHAHPPPHQPIYITIVAVVGSRGGSVVVGGGGDADCRLYNAHNSHLFTYYQRCYYYYYSHTRLPVRTHSRRSGSLAFAGILIHGSERNAIKFLFLIIAIARYGLESSVRACVCARKDITGVSRPIDEERAIK